VILRLRNWSSYILGQWSLSERPLRQAKPSRRLISDLSPTDTPRSGSAGWVRRGGGRQSTSSRLSPKLITVNWLVNGGPSSPANKRLFVTSHSDSQNYRRARNIILEIENFFRVSSLASLVNIPSYEPSRCLRSTNGHHLAVPSCVKSSFASRAFCVSSPNNWNSLPAHIRSSSCHFPILP